MFDHVGLNVKEPRREPELLRAGARTARVPRRDGVRGPRVGVRARGEAVAAGGRDNGGPGLREYYHPTYYGAFVLDPDGNNVEAVRHSGE